MADPSPSTPDPSKVASSSSPGSPPTSPLSPIYRSPVRPLRSILRPPPPPPKTVFTSITQNFLSLPSKLGLPSTTAAPPPAATTTPANGAAPAPSTAVAAVPAPKKPLKQAHFRMPVLSVTYSISSSLPPCSPETSKARLQAEEALRDTLVGLKEGAWDFERVDQFYRDCCRTREERVDERIVIAFKHGLNAKPRILDLTNIPLSLHAAAAIADVLALNLQLQKLILEGCDLDELSLKPILHSLLISASLPSLSLANNPRLRPQALSLLTTYLSRAKMLTTLDLSGVPLPPPAAQILISVLNKPEEDDASQLGSPRSKGKGIRREDWEVARLLLSDPWPEDGEEAGDGLVTLRLDNCSLKPASLEVLAHAIRPSTLCHLSLRNNRISTAGAVALAVLMKDYPDTFFTPMTMPSATPPPPPPRPPPRPIATPTSPTAPAASPTTTYAAYVPKVKRIQHQQALAAMKEGRPPPPVHQVPPLPPSLSSTSLASTPRSTPSGSPHSKDTPLPPIITSPRRLSPPLITSNADGGITTRHPSSSREHEKGRHPSPALLSNVRGMDELPRLGRLRTVDLKGNDIRSGVTYIAQVLKRNRTLRVLNLAENRIDEKGLTVLAEALKYNETLETLDLSGNPVCGPSLEGVTSLRMAFTVNHSLKRLFLSNTSLTSPAAIHLAEFIPESSTLLHLDLTRNELEYAGILALSVAMRNNFTMRCLDLSIPPNEEQAARCSREILQACVRNTEKAGRGGELLGRSEILNTVREEDAKKGLIIREPLGRSEKERLKVVRLTEEEVLDVVGEVCRGERDIGHEARKALTERLEEMIRAERREDRLKELLELVDGLAASEKVPSKGKGKSKMNGGVHLNGLDLEVGGSSSGPSTPATMSPQSLLSPTPVHSLSPAFSITSGSDDEGSDDEPLGAGVDPDAEELSRDFKPSEVSSAAATSPVEERSRDWVVEEAEVFRRGHALLTEDDLDEGGKVTEVSGDDLRKELLETEVQRPPPRPIPQEEDEPLPGSPEQRLSLFPDGS